tara:strand:+ start:998 stop:1807 length:810 start_codon:yes stop_codon:yes gene_type:complete
MKNYIILLLCILFCGFLNAQNTLSYRYGLYDGTYIHGVDNFGQPADSSDPSYRELPPGVSQGVYNWWNYSTAVGQPSGSYGVAIGFGKGSAGSAEIWAGWSNGKLYTRFLRDCCQGWSSWNEIWTANTDGAESGLDADTVDGLQAVLLQSSGNVGIGTTTPDSKLTVKGNIHAEEVKVDLSVPAPDYVFKEDYKLKTLEETQKYINENGHLPNIPSAKEFEENGVELGVMNMKLLEKIEELTLYILEQDKKLKEMDEIKNRIDALEKKN